jgi:hypothetical protein
VQPAPAAAVALRYCVPGDPMGAVTTARAPRARACVRPRLNQANRQEEKHGRRQVVTEALAGATGVISRFPPHPAGRPSDRPRGHAPGSVRAQKGEKEPPSGRRHTGQKG